MKSRFELDHVTTEPGPARATGPESLGSKSIDRERIDPERLDPEFHDAREYRFDSCQEKSPERSRFVVEEQLSCVDLLTDNPQKYPDRQNNVIVEGHGATVTSRPAVPRRLLPKAADSSQPGSENSWRQEVTERLNNYQARRRPRGPRYPSLQLKFETQEMAWPDPSAEVTAKSLSGAVRHAAFVSPAPEIETHLLAPIVEPTARIIAFPRSSTTSPIPVEELAEPVFDRPRIMEAPELSPVPALGGILIERTESHANEKRPGFEMPLQSARMARRLAATAIDAFVVLVGLTSFGCIFWRITGMVPPIRLAAGIIAIVGGILWAAYQYLLIVYCGTSPGLKLAKLKLNHFDGSSVPRKIRRWRVFASILSGLSLGLGYAWCFLDEDQLCWHDRITRTYMAPEA